MGGINVMRWITGGLVAGITIFIVLGAASPFVMEPMQAELEGKNLAPITPATWVGLMLLGVVFGLLLVFFYAAARPRFGAGPRTAVIVGVAAWVGGPLTGSVIFAALGVFSLAMTALGVFIDLIAIVAGSLAGAWVYREEAIAPAGEPAVV